MIFMIILSVVLFAIAVGIMPFIEKNPNWAYVSYFLCIGVNLVWIIGNNPWHPMSWLSIGCILFFVVSHYSLHGIK